MIAPALIRPAHGGYPEVRALPAMGPVELVDALAYFGRKRANAAVIAARLPEFANEAQWTMRQCDVFADDFRAGLHRGVAATERELKL